MDKVQIANAIKEGKLNDWEIIRVYGKLPVKKGKKVVQYVHQNEELNKKIENIRVEIEGVKSFLARLIFQLDKAVEDASSSDEEEADPHEEEKDDEKE